MSTRRKIIKLAVAATLLSVTAAILLSYATLDITRFAPAIANEYEKRFGYKLKADRINIKLLPELDINIQGAAVSNGLTQTMSAKTIRMRVAILPLIVNKTVIRQIEADGVNLTAAISDIKRLMAAKAETKKPAPVIDNIELRGIKIRLIDDTDNIANANNKTLEADVSKASIYKKEDGFVLNVDGATKHGAEFSTSGRWESSTHTLTGMGVARNMDIEILQRYFGINPEKTVSFKGAADAKITYSIGAKVSLAGNVVIRDVTVRLPALTKPLRLNGSAAGEINIENGIYKAVLERIELNMEDFTATGSINAHGSGTDANFTITASTTPIPLSTLKRLASSIPMPAAAAPIIAKIENLSGTAAFETINASGAIKNGRLDKRGLIDKLNLSIRLDNTAFLYQGLSASFKDISGRVTFKNMAISAENIQGRYGNITLQNLSAQVTRLRAAPNYDIALKGIFEASESARLVNELGWNAAWVSSRLADKRLSGDVSLSANLKGELGSNKSMRYSGVARLREITAADLNTQSIIGPMSANFSFDNEQLQINNLSADIDNSNIQLSGYVSDYTSETASGRLSANALLTNETIQKYLWKNAPAFSGKLNIKANIIGGFDGFSAAASVITSSMPVDDKKVISLSGAQLSAKGIKIRSGALSEVESIEAEIKNARVYGHICRDVNATAAVTKDSIDGALRLIIDDGEALGTLQYFRAPDAAHAFEAAVTLNGVKLEEILTAFNVKSRIISGPVFGTGAFFVKKGGEKFISRLNGAISLQANRGRLYKFLLFNKIFSIVNIISIDELFKEGLPFKTLKGSFTVTDGVLATDGLYLDSDSMRMSAVGNIDMTIAAIETYVVMYPFVTIDKLISIIPLAGWVIAGKDKTGTGLYYKVEGPLANPDVSPALIKGLTSGIAGILKRLETMTEETPIQDGK